MRTLALLGFLVASSAYAADPPIATLFASRCAACHATTGKGDTAAGKQLGAGDMTSAEWHKARPNDQQLAQSIAQGKRRGEQTVMPAASDLKPEQLQALVALVRSFGPKKTP